MLHDQVGFDGNESTREVGMSSSTGFKKALFTTSCLKRREPDCNEQAVWSLGYPVDSTDHQTCSTHKILVVKSTFPTDEKHKVMQSEGFVC